MNVLVIGSGGREHALCWAILKSPLCSNLYCAPGNAGIAGITECLPIPVDQITSLVDACKDKKIELVIVGPELPLTLGLADALRKANILCFGPDQAAAALEGSKGFMKNLCAMAKVPTATYQSFTNAEAAKAYIRTHDVPIVVKADGLAAGKGVTVATTIDQALDAIDDAMVKKIFGEAGSQVVIEEFLVGEEVSFFALCDGKIALPFASAQDHKTAYDGDKGPNTGGMGAYSPTPLIDEAMETRIMREIITPVIETMRASGKPFQGVLFAGLMMTPQGPKLLEFNVRFGDPETQAILPRLHSDLLQILLAASQGKLDEIKLKMNNLAALCVVMAAEGYPGDYKKNTVIRGFEQAAKVPGTYVFHAGTLKSGNGDILANGGRVLGVTGWGPTIVEAQTHAYQALEKIQWPEGFCRRDIGWRAIARTRAA